MKYQTRIPRLIGTKDDEFYIWFLSVKSTLRRKETLSLLTSDEGSSVATRPTLSDKISASRPGPLRVIQQCDTVKRPLHILHVWYATKNLINKLIVLNSALNTELKKTEFTEKRIALMESNFARLAAMKDSVIESIKVAIPTSSLSNLSEYAAVPESMNTTKSGDVPSSFATVNFAAKNDRHHQIQKIMSRIISTTGS